MQKVFSAGIRVLPLTAAVTVLSLSAAYIALAWTEPVGTMPVTVAAPLNTGDIAQTKAGALAVTGDFTAPIFYDIGNNAYYVDPAGQTVLSGPVGIGITSFVNYPYAAVVGSKGIAGSATGAFLGVAGEALSDGTKNATGILGIGKGSGTYSGKGIEGAGYVSASADTATVYGGSFYADSTHSGGINVGARGYANYSSYENYGVQGVAVTPSTGSTYLTIGVYGTGTTYGSTSAVGIYGKGLVNATTDTAGAYGSIFYSNAAHASGTNYAVYSNAANGASNFSFYGAAGVLYNADSVGIGTTAPTEKLEVVGNIKASGTVSASGGVTNLPAPVAASDAATKAYVDALGGGGGTGGGSYISWGYFLGTYSGQDAPACYPGWTSVYSGFGWIPFYAPGSTSVTGVGETMCINGSGSASGDPTIPAKFITGQTSSGGSGVLSVGGGGGFLRCRVCAK